MISPSPGRCLSIPYLWLTRMWNGDAVDITAILDLLCSKSAMELARERLIEIRLELG